MFDFKFVILSTILNVNFVVIGRVIQGASISKINVDKIEEIELKPKLYCNFTTLRFFYMMLILYNSILIADDFEWLSIVLYLIYWLPVVWWWNNFYNLNFQYSIFYSSWSAKFSTILALLLEPHPTLWIPTCLFSVYLLYLSLWYKFALPT